MPPSSSARAAAASAGLREMSATKLNCRHGVGVEEERRTVERGAPGSSQPAPTARARAPAAPGRPERKGRGAAALGAARTRSPARLILLWRASGAGGQRAPRRLLQQARSWAVWVGDDAAHASQRLVVARGRRQRRATGARGGPCHTRRGPQLGEAPGQRAGVDRRRRWRQRMVACASEGGKGAHASEGRARHWGSGSWQHRWALLALSLGLGSRKGVHFFSVHAMGGIPTSCTWKMTGRPGTTCATARSAATFAWAACFCRAFCAARPAPPPPPGNFERAQNLQGRLCLGLCYAMDSTSIPGPVVVRRGHR
jgi:hypothetical protein